MKEPLNAQTRTAPVQPPGLTIGDIYYMLFRHKWKIIVFPILGILGAVLYYRANPPLYESETKILIRYVLENKGLTPEANDAQVKSPDWRGDNIINAELEILTSYDIAVLVAEAVGPERILARLGGGNNAVMAASVIRAHLLVEAPRRSNIIRIIFRHPDPAVVRPVLSQLVDTYVKRHMEIHRGGGTLDEFFSHQADELRARLTQTEGELKKLKTDAQVISLDDDKHAYIAQIAKIQIDLLSSEAELAERRAALSELEKMVPSAAAEKVAEAGVPADKAYRYRAVWVDLEALQNRQRELLLRFTDEHPLVKQLGQQIAETQAQKRQLEQEYPNLPKVVTQTSITVAGSQHNIDLASEVARVSSIAAKIAVLKTQLEKVRQEATRVIQIEPAIAQLQRTRELQETNYRYYASSLEQARVHESLGAGKVTNIIVVQTPSPVSRAWTGAMRPIALILVLGFLAGPVLAFVQERILDQTLKRVPDLERYLRLPVFLSIPKTSPNGRSHSFRIFRNGHHRRQTGSDSAEGAQSGNGQHERAAEVAPWDTQHSLHLYFEALRDRLITYFEVRDMSHRPKLVAVTSCSPRAGVTTLAAGLAATLSETGDGNVLLVDMNLEQGAAHRFHKGKPGCGLSEALENAKPDNALVHDNLYLVSALESNNQKLPRVLPKRFAHLVPKMKASDYDYIIFDMPPVTQTSVTPRLSGFMDVILLVVESERTGQEIANRAKALLDESGANTAALLNKHRSYVPQRLTQEL